MNTPNFCVSHPQRRLRVEALERRVVPQANTLTGVTGAEGLFGEPLIESTFADISPFQSLAEDVSGLTPTADVTVIETPNPIVESLISGDLSTTGLEPSLPSPTAVNPLTEPLAPSITGFGIPGGTVSPSIVDAVFGVQPSPANSFLPNLFANSTPNNLAILG